MKRIGVAAALWCAAFSWAGAAELSVTVSRSFPVGSTPTAHLSGTGFSSVQFRVYRIADPAAFAQNPAAVPAPAPRPFEDDSAAASADTRAIDALFKTPSMRPEGMQGLGKTLLPEAARRRLREWLGVAWQPPFERGRRLDTRPALTSYPLVAAWSQRVATSDFYAYEDIQIPVSDPGLYLIEAIAGELTAYTVAAVTDLAFQTKRSKDRLLVSAARRADAAPWAGARVYVFNRGAGRGGDGLPTGSIHATGETDEQGFWQGGVPEGDAFILAVSGEHVALARTRRHWRKEPSWVFYIYTDRPAYRPGHKVFYKVIARRFEDGDYHLAPGRSVSIEIKDAAYNPVARQTATLNEFGSFAGELALSDEAALGRYSIEARIDDAVDAGIFEVQAYRKPEFRVSVTPARGRALIGDELEFTVDARYLFGAPVPGASVNYVLSCQPYWSWAAYDPSSDEDRAESAGDGYGARTLEAGEAKLDAEGKLVLRFRAEPNERRREWWTPRDYTFRLQANIADSSQRTVSGGASVLATHGEFFLGVETDKYVYKPGETARVTVFARDYAGAPRDAEVTLSLRPDGSTKVLEEKTARLSGGLAEIPFEVTSGGSFRIEARARDGGGREIASTGYIWAAADGESWGSAEGRLSILADRKEYAPGETARLLIVSPVAGVEALVAVEGSGLHSRRLVRFAGNTAMVEVPIDDRFMPNAFVTASFIRGEQRYVAERRIAVSPAKKLLDVTVQTDKPVVKPGEEVTFTVQARDHEGRPARAEVSIGVVDEGIYLLVPELARPIREAFYARRPNYVGTESSLDFWVRGYASDRDRGRAAEPAMDEFQGDDVKGGLVEPRVRRRFEDTMLWRADVVTGADGRAVLRAATPDNLTTWRFTSRAITPSTQVGQHSGTFIERKNLLVRLQAPRFYRQGDEAVVSAVVHNYLKNEKEARVSLQVQGLELQEKSAEQVRSISPEGSARFEWRVAAPDAGNALVTVRALTDEESDAMELPVPVLPHGIETVVARAGDASKGGAEDFSVPAGAIAAASKLTLHLTPSFAATILQAVPYLAAYPYGCVEQTMSRFGPTLAAADAFRQLSLPTDGMPKDLPKMVRKGVERLARQQHADGGWGWWENDETHPFMTAYALSGLLQARASGYDVADELIERGGLSLSRQLAESGADAATRAYMLNVLSQIPERRDEAAALLELAVRANAELNDHAKALLVLGCARLGRADLTAPLVRQLERSAIRSETTVHWSGRDWRYEWQNDSVQTTAAVLRALVRAQPKSPLIAPAVRWLVLSRQGPVWRSTQDTAAVVYAMVDYLKASAELSPESRVRVLWNGREIADRRFTRASLFQAAEPLVVPAADIRPGKNRLEIRKEGAGTLYYAASLSTVEKREDIDAAPAPAFEVRREVRRLVEDRVGDRMGYRPESFGSLSPGDQVLVTVTVTAKADQEYFMLEDPIPSGFEAVENFDRYHIEGVSRSGAEDGAWAWWYAAREIRDDRVAFFATRLPKGERQFSYVLRAEQAGELHVMPATARLMYVPEVRATSAEHRLRVKD